MDDKSKELSIEFLEKWCGKLRIHFDCGGVFPTISKREQEELVGGLNFILCALRGDTNIIHDSYPK